MPSMVTDLEYKIFYIGLGLCLIYGLVVGVWEMFRKK